MSTVYRCCVCSLSVVRVSKAEKGGEVSRRWELNSVVCKQKSGHAPFHSPSPLAPMRFVNMCRYKTGHVKASLHVVCIGLLTTYSQ